MRVAEAKNITDLISALESLRQERLKARTAFEEIWWNNIALVAGDHYMRWEPTVGGYVERQFDDHNIRLVLNHARVVARTELGKLNKSKPITDIMPQSDDGEDIAAAEVGQFALDSMEWKFRLRDTRSTAKWWMILTGVGAIYCGWDPVDARDGYQKYYIDPNTGDATFNQKRINELKQLYEGGEIDELTESEDPLGDCCFDVYSPFQILPDDTVLRFKDIGDIITTDVVDLDKAIGNWKPKQELRADDKQPGVIEGRMIRRLGVGAGSAFSTNTSSKVVQIHTYWLKPGIFPQNSYLRDGIMVRWANRNIKLEENAPFPYTDNELPFVFFEHIPNATAIWPDSVIEDIRSPNIELDKTVSQLLENRDMMVNPMWRIPEQCRVSGKIVSKPGGELRYVHVRDIPPPEPIPGTPLPVQIENLAVALRDQILDISGQGEVSRGRVPSGARAGVMLQYLNEEDETRLGPTADNCGEATARMGSLILSRLSQFYSTERLMRGFKRGGGFAVRKFKGADLKGNTDVVFLEGTANARSKAARQQNALTAVEMGMPMSPKKLHDLLELGGGEPDEIDLAMAQADRENELMTKNILTPREQLRQRIESPPGAQNEDTYVAGGAPTQNGGEAQGPVAVPVKNWHNHQVHLERHRRYMMQEEFERLTNLHPDIVRLFDEHVAMHEQILQQQAQAQMEQAMAMRGMPDGPPGQPPQAKPGAQAAGPAPPQMGG